MIMKSDITVLSIFEPPCCLLSLRHLHFGCDGPCDDSLECCQCLEIFKDRSVKVAFDTWERAYYCSKASSSARGVEWDGRAFDGKKLI